MIPVNLGDQLQVKDLLPVQAVTADGLSSAIDLAGLDGEIAVIVDVGACGAGKTLDLKLQESDSSGGSYTDVANGAFAQVGNAASVQKISLNKGELKQFVKLSMDVTGASFSALASAKIVGIKKYPA